MYIYKLNSVLDKMLRSLFRLPRQLQGKTTPYSPVSFFSSTSQLKTPPASEQEPEHRPSNPAPAAARTKIWSFDSFFDDHTKVFRVLPKLISAYATDPIDPVLNEAVMLTVNSVNDCSYCTGLHGPLAKMAGINQVEIDRLEKGNSTAAAAHESQSATERETRDIVLRYAREFALSSGHDLYSKVRDAEHTTDASANESAGQAQEKLDSMLSEVERVLGTRRKAESINALCWFLHWGSIGGNTLNSFMFKTVLGKAQYDSVLPHPFHADNLPHSTAAHTGGDKKVLGPSEAHSPMRNVSEYLMLSTYQSYHFMYYGPLFFVIKALSPVLEKMPRPVAPIVSGSIGVVLTVTAGAWITPVAVLGTLTKPIRRHLSKALPL